MADPAPLQCPRCGYYPVPEVDICWACADGKADAVRARRLIDAASSDVAGASRILAQVGDKQALPVLLESLATGVGGRVRRAIVSAAGYAGGDDGAAVDALLGELWNSDLEIAGEAVDALADSSANQAAVTDALAAVMVARPQLEVKAAIVIGWRRDERALPILERELSRGSLGPYNLNLAPGPMLGRLGAPGRRALGRQLTRVLAANPEPQVHWSAVDRLVREHLDGLLGRLGSPSPDGLAVALQAVEGHAWAQERLEEVVAQLEGRAPPGAPPMLPIDPAARVVPGWGMRLRRVDVAEPGPTTRFGGQPHFAGDPVWPLHPGNRLPLTFLCQIAVPASVAGDGTWLAQVFVDLIGNDSVADPEYGFPVQATAVIVHPGKRWWGPMEQLRTGPTYAYEWPEEWPARAPRRERFRSGPQFGFVISQVDLAPGADPVDWELAEGPDTTNDDWNKVGGTALTLQGGEDRLLDRGWRFLASWDAWRVGREMGDGAHCCVWVHPDGRGLLNVQSH